MMEAYCRIWKVGMGLIALAVLVFAVLVGWSPISMTTRLLLILAVPLTLIGFKYALIGFKYVAAPAMLLYWVSTADSYPSFMADYHPPRLYADLASSFDHALPVSNPEI
jgi:hypothetical protein